MLAIPGAQFIALTRRPPIVGAEWRLTCRASIPTATSTSSGEINHGPKESAATSRW